MSKKQKTGQSAVTPAPTFHNHGPNYGVIVEGCPRCREIQAKPYVLTFKIAGDKKLRRHKVASVRDAIAIVQAALPAEAVRLPIVTTRGGGTVAILQVS